MLRYRIKVLVTGIFLLNMLPLFATHYRAGEITYRQVSGLTYEITAITYTDPSNASADRSEIEIVFGDGKSAVVPRSNGNGEQVNLDPANLVKKNIYLTTHTYPGPSSDGYIINLTDPNRVANVRNINDGESVNIPFYVESKLIIGASDHNQSPSLPLPPIDVGCIFKEFTHNPIATDPDGDSLVFRIIAPKMAVGTEVPHFTIPSHTVSFGVDPHTGQVTWTTPDVQGFYNFAIEIREYRLGVLQGYVVRDMQVYINSNCFNDPPQFVEVRDTCIEANKLFQYEISAYDPNPGQIITIRKYGGPFVQTRSPAVIVPDPAIGPSAGVKTLFKWTPSCYAIRYNTHQAGFRVSDNYITVLSRIMNWNIKVVGPAPKNVKIQQDSNGFVLTWDKDECDLAYGYKIYRRVDSSHWTHGACVTGVDEIQSGYRLYDTTQGVANTRFFDNENGRGISPLIRYCYLVTSFYPPRTESGAIIVSKPVEGYASDEVCDIILRTKPVITNVSVEATSVTDGKIFVKWLRPTVLDPAQYPPPYRMVLQRSTQPNGGYVNTGAQYDYASPGALTDEQYTDTLLNTQDKQYYYKVLFLATLKGNLMQIEESIYASSVRLTLLPDNRSLLVKWNASVPWQNYQATVYRKNALNTFDSIGVSNTGSYLDTGLYNGFNYCYYVQTKGKYDFQYYPFTLLNKSQQSCNAPKDTVRPCTPVLSIDTPCSSCSSTSDFKVTLNWVYADNCDKDVTRFRILWKKYEKDPWMQIDSVKYPVNNYVDGRELLKFSIAGCYAVIAVDSFDNASYANNAKCIDNCPHYLIPNVFTPDGDNMNDLLKPFPYCFIDKVDFTMYNRWGQVVYHINDIDINWTGKDQKTGLECPEGVYYYICDVYESYLEGTRKRTLKGSVQLIR